jgi:hypothetical protein
MKTISVVLTAVLAASSAKADFGPHGLEGNDRGGIIPWAPAIELIYRQLAADHCARFSKGSLITSVHHKAGHYVAFECRFDRGYDPVKELSFGVDPGRAHSVPIQRSAPAARRTLTVTAPAAK